MTAGAERLAVDASARQPGRGRAAGSATPVIARRDRVSCSLQALLGRTVSRSRADLGLTAPERVITLSVPLGESLDPATRLATVERLVTGAQRLPGVAAAGFGAALPPRQAGLDFTVRVSTSDRAVDATRAFDLVPVTAGYFEALGAQVLEGRTFTAADTESGNPVCVLSETAARHLRLAVTTAVGRELSARLLARTDQARRPIVVGITRMSATRA